jgi:hypothetical protein
VAFDKNRAERSVAAPAAAAAAAAAVAAARSNERTLALALVASSGLLPSQTAWLLQSTAAAAAASALDSAVECPVPILFPTGAVPGLFPSGAEAVRDEHEVAKCVVCLESLAS